MAQLVAKWNVEAFGVCSGSFPLRVGYKFIMLPQLELELNLNASFSYKLNVVFFCTLHYYGSVTCRCQQWQSVCVCVCVRTFLGGHCCVIV